MRVELPKLPADYFDCIVTSPPYFGLRDYGTATWEGGDDACGHIEKESARNDVTAVRLAERAAQYGTGQGDGSKVSAVQFRNLCPKCGARRVDSQIGLEPTLDAYLETMVAVCRELRRVLKPSGVMFLNIGDSYAQSEIRHRQGGNGSTLRNGNCKADEKWAAGTAQTGRKINHGLKPKDLMLVPQRLGIRLQEDGWWVRSHIIWAKKNPMPESVQGSHFSRHMVTISDYERLSGLPYIDERAGDAWAGNMPNLYEAEISSGKAPISAERERQRDRSCSGGARGRAGKTPSVCSINAGEKEPGEVHCDFEGQSDQASFEQTISGKRPRETDDCRTPLGYEEQSSPHSAAEESQRDVCEDRQDGCEEATGLCTAESSDRRGDAIHCEDVDRSDSASQEPLLLLQTTASSDARSRDPCQQGREARGGKHRSSVQKLQLQEGEPDRSSLLVGCPGCEKCARHHGYTFHMSAGRPTSVHETIWMLTKSENYFWDAEAVAEEVSGTGGAKRRRAMVFDGKKASKSLELKSLGFSGGNDGTRNPDATTRNMRNVWHVASQPFPGAHFATMPAEIAERCIKASSPSRGRVLDPFGGSGTTGLVADRLGRDCTLIDLNTKYMDMARDRIIADGPLFAEVEAV